MIVYKVTYGSQSPYCNDHREVSNQASGKAIVTYKENKFVQAPEWLAEKGYHCCVFSSLKYALRFKRTNGGNVWAARAVGVRETDDHPRYPVGSVSYDDMDCQEGYFGWWPPGTLFAKNVKLLARIRC